jgi:tRNA threonylcarbamoyladenosine biosynthesis protein TsaB
MPYLLNIETSTNVCSVALSDGKDVLILKEDFKVNNHASVLTVMIGEVLNEAGINMSQLSAVAVSKGPGSYTGLRIGVSTAKGICYAAGLPLIAISTLQAMALGMVMKLKKGMDPGIKPDDWLCPMIDARRMEVYCAFYDAENRLQKEIRAEIIEPSTFASILEGHRVIFFGNGAAKCREILAGKNVLILEGFDPSAAFMAALSKRSFEGKDFVDVAYFEPFYLKDFVTTISKKKVF